MFAFAKYIPVFMQFLIAIPQLVQTAETAFSGKPGSGAAKKDLVVGIVNQGLTTYQQVASDKLPPESVVAIQETVSTVIDVTVNAMNAGEVLAHGTVGGSLTR